MNFLTKMVVVWLISMVAIIFFSRFIPPAHAGSVIIYEVLDLETAGRAVIRNAITVNEMVCVLTPDGSGFTNNPRKWQGFTCAKLGVSPVVWQFCRGTLDKPELLCVSTDFVINGKVEDATPGLEPKNRMSTF